MEPSNRVSMIGRFELVDGTLVFKGGRVELEPPRRSPSTPMRCSAWSVFGVPMQMPLIPVIMAEHLREYFASMHGVNAPATTDRDRGAVRVLPRRTMLDRSSMSCSLRFKLRRPPF
jgi:hypothetical protein